MLEKTSSLLVDNLRTISRTILARILMADILYQVLGTWYSSLTWRIRRAEKLSTVMNGLVAYRYLVLQYVHFPLLTPGRW
jgi:hypothetical protein